MNKLQAAVVVAAGVVVSGCAAPSPLPPVDVSPDIEAQAQDAVRRGLKDPDSARFGGMRAGRDPRDGSTVVCGMVNAKNGFGGYTGSAPFQVRFRSGSAVVEAVDDGARGSVGLAQIWCRNNGLLG